jgi:hypothetical protein
METPNGTEPPDGGASKRRRRRRRGPRVSDPKSSDQPRESKPEGARKSEGARKPEGARHGGNRRGRGGRAHRAAKVLSRQTESVDLDKNAEAPLTEQEIGVLREHFRFLRNHRNDLRLKVNANEDLLLNGAREPVHRGVCHHLLAKVERKNVLAAAERLEPARAAKFLAGIIRFSSDIEYVLLFLEKIQQSSSPAEATAALFQGLQRIEFDKVSSAQMRRVLQLITELFDENELPTLLLGMLESESFRSAFDKSTADLPDALSHLVLPLRAAQAVILHGEPNTFDSETLSHGVALLLGLDSKILLRHSADMRQRLFDFGLQTCSAPDHSLHDRLKMLLRNFPKADSKRRERGVALARHFIEANSDAAAKQLLQTLASENPGFDVPVQWLSYLEAESFDRIVLLTEPSGRKDALGDHPRREGIWLETMQPVWVQIARPDAVSRHEETRSLMCELAAPGVASVLKYGATNEAEPYFIIANSGESLERALTDNAGLELGESVRLCHEAVGLFSALAALGVRLPDASLFRFSIEGLGRLRLTDLAGAQRVDPDVRGGFHFELARGFCTEVLSCARRHIVPADVSSVVSGSKSCAELASGLARCRAMADEPLRRHSQ